MQDQAQGLIPAYAHWVTRWRWPVLIACLLAAAAATSGLLHLETTADFRVYFGPENPQLMAYEALEDTYTKTDNILFVLQPKDKNVFTRETLGIVKQLTEEAWQIPYAIRVDSITNFQHTEAVGDDLTVADLVDRPEGLTNAQLAKIKNVALNEPALVKRLIAADAGTAGVLVTLQFPGTDHTEHLPNSVTHAYAMVEDLRATHSDLTVALTGLAVMSYVEGQVSELDMRTLVPMMYGLMIACMLLLLRSVSGTAATLVIVTLSAMTALGLGSWLGIKLNPASAIAPIIILTLAIADSVHILLTAFHEMREGRSKHDALIESLHVNTEPVFLTSLTTTIGFLSLNFSDSPPFHDLGNIAAMGVVAAWVFSMTVIPALVSILPFRVKPRAKGLRLPMDRFGDFVVTKRTPLLWSVTAIALLIIAFIPRIEVDDRFVKFFDESLPFRADTDFATANLVGPYTLEFSIGSGEAGGIAEPAYLERLEAFSVWLRAQPDITQVNSFTDVMKRVNKSMHGDDPDWYRLPDERNLAAQYLLLYEMSLPYGLDLNSQVNVDKSATRLTVTLDTVPTKRMREIADRAESWLAENAPPAMQAEASGASIMFAYLTERNIRTMLGGTALAFLLISATLVIALRNARLGLISLIPNFIPVLMTFGLWGAFVGEIGIIASVITATSLGLIVDDTVHILSKYNRAKHEHCLNVHDAVRFTFSHVGTALWMTTLILVAGFAVLGLSTFKVNADLGILTAITLTFALVMDFLLLPPLLMRIDREEKCNCTTCKCDLG
ncbi:MAG: RND family transporter [Candidatus Methylomirabilales bacterium]